MFCMRCGQQIADDAKFCPICGNPVGKQETGSPVQTNEVPQPNPGMGENPPQQPYVYYPGPQGMPPVGQPAPKKGGKVNGKMIGLIAGAAALVVALVVLGILFVPKFLNRASGNAYVYMSDGNYMLVSNIDKDKVTEIAAAKSNAYATEDMLTFSEDGKYIYYFTKVDSNDRVGTLCRAEFAKLRSGSANNEKYIKIIATNVYMDLHFPGDGAVIYANTDQSLFRFDGEKSERIVKNCAQYWFDEHDDCVLYTVEDGEEYDRVLQDLYVQELMPVKAEGEEEAKLPAPRLLFDAATGVSVLDETFEQILCMRYVQEEEEETGSYLRREELWVTGLELKPVKISDNGEPAPSQGAILFAEKSETPIVLYDYINDPTAAADRNVTEPLLDDYGTPTYRYDMITGSKPVESDYELYTSTTLPLYWYGERRSAYSMEKSIGKGYDPAIEEMTQAFINKYKDQEDENGLIPVTDEVKEDLKKINALAADERNQWLWLCLAKVQDGVEYDYESYNADYAVYSEAMNRNSARENLMQPSDETDLYDVYAYEDGEVKLLVKDVVDSDDFEGLLLFLPLEDVTGKVEFEELMENGYEPLADLFSLDGDGEVPLQAIDVQTGRILTLSTDVIATFIADNGNGDLYVLDDHAYYVEDSGALWMAKITDGTVGAPEILTDEAQQAVELDGKLYFFSGVYYDSGAELGDLYRVEEGEMVCLAKDVATRATTLYEDGALLAGMSYSSYSGTDLNYIDPKGEVTFIAAGVSEFKRVDETHILYICNDDLYCYDGKESRMVAMDVEQVWTQKEMPTEALFMSYDSYDYYGW